jgi:hypothetical protein
MFDQEDRAVPAQTAGVLDPPAAHGAEPRRPLQQCPVADTGDLEAGRRNRPAAAVQNGGGQRLLVRVDPHVVLVADFHRQRSSRLRTLLGHHGLLSQA